MTWKQITGVLGLFLGLFQVMQSISSTIFHHRGEDLFKTADSMVTQGFHHSKICHGWRTPFIQAVNWRTSWAFGRCRAVPKSKVVQGRPNSASHFAEIAAFLQFALQTSSTARSKTLGIETIGDLSSPLRSAYRNQHLRLKCLTTHARETLRNPDGNAVVSMGN